MTACQISGYNSVISGTQTHQALSLIIRASHFPTLPETRWRLIVTGLSLSALYSPYPAFSVHSVQQESASEHALLCRPTLRGDVRLSVSSPHTQ